MNKLRDREVERYLKSYLAAMYGFYEGVYLEYGSLLN